MEQTSHCFALLDGQARCLSFLGECHGSYLLFLKKKSQTKIVRVTETDRKPILKDFLGKTEQIRGKKIPLGLLFLSVVLCTTLSSANNRPRAMPSD